MTTVRAIELRMIGLPLVGPFRTSFGVETEKVCLLARVVTDDAEGWGECVSGIDPGYSEEFNEGVWLVIRGFLAPVLFSTGDVTIDDLDRVLSGVRGNPMAKATVVDAFLDAELRANGRSLA
ncbi:MAG: o-succinylbenzoate synthase, partial [Actinomycetota bacterium]|nr:o-succinylbenzoate synthase [Actinomycetota bacterium]